VTRHSGKQSMQRCLFPGFALLAVLCVLAVRCGSSDDGGLQWSGPRGWEEVVTDSMAGDDSGSTYYVDPGDTGSKTKDWNLPPKPLEVCLDYLDESSLAPAFSKECQSSAVCPCGGVDLGEVIAHAIEDAEVSVDLCVMQLQDFTISDALIAAQERDVAVRIIVDDGYATADIEKAIEHLQAAGVAILADSSSNKLMHSKFVVIDGATSLISSGNFSTYDASSNANNLLLFRSPALATGLLSRFDDMWTDKAFYNPADAGPFSTTVDGAKVHWYHGPDWAMIDALVSAIEGAEEAIHFSIFSFTLESVKEALTDRCGEVELLGLYDESQANGDDSMAPAGWCPQADIRKAKIEGDFGFKKLHHKYLIVDPGVDGKGTVITGSANWSYSAATKNAELMVQVRDGQVVQAFESEFQARFAHSL
jgi:phosphatidylserine/phosphatidylglycerophosphate/cardiolipin synthase-like enzyme